MQTFAHSSLYHHHPRSFFSGKLAAWKFYLACHGENTLLFRHKVRLFPHLCIHKRSRNRPVRICSQVSISVFHKGSRDRSLTICSWLFLYLWNTAVFSLKKPFEILIFMCRLTFLELESSCLSLLHREITKVCVASFGQIIFKSPNA